jgi:hypothetical protein
VRLYLNLSDESGIRGYDFGWNFIDIYFNHEDTPFRYTNDGVGRETVQLMKRLAVSGRGLGAFIATSRGDRRRGASQRSD